MMITGVQVFLGMTAFLMRLMNMSGTIGFLVVSVAHVATGNLTLAVSVMLAIEIRRSVLARVRRLGATRVAGRGGQGALDEGVRPTLG